MTFKFNHKEKLVCLSCRYETDYLGTYVKPPVCPHCKNLLSFKDSGAVRLNEEVNDAWMNRILIGIAVLIIFMAGIFIRHHFQTFDYRALVKQEVRIGEKFYGGSSRSRIPNEWLRMTYSFESYWNHSFHARADVMINEEHWYIYNGTRSDQIELEYFYKDSKGKKGSRIIPLKLAGNMAYLDIPALPYVSKPSKARLKVVLEPSGNQIRISESR